MGSLFCSVAGALHLQAAAKPIRLSGVSLSVSKSELIELYLAYFGRPPDAAGLAYYTSNPAFSLQTVSADFSTSAESIALYGSASGSAPINAIYQNLFNRDAEPDALSYWSAEITSGRLTAASAALAILQGAQNSDRTAVQNKVAVATAFVVQLDTPAEIAGYSGAAAAASARAFLKTVDATAASLFAANSALLHQVGLATNPPAPAPAPSAPAPAPAPFTLVEATHAVSLSGTSTDAFVYTLNGAATRAASPVTASSGSLTNSVTSFSAAGYAGATTVTLNAAGDSVTGGSGDDTVKVLALRATGNLNGGAPFGNAIEVRDGADLSGATLSNFVRLTFDSTGVAGTNDLTMTAAQHALFISMNVAANGAGGESITLTTAFNGSGLSNIEKYILQAASTFTLGSTVQQVSGSIAADTFNVGQLSLNATSVLDGGTGAANTLNVRDLANLSQAAISNITQLNFDATSVTGTNDVSMTAAQYLAFTGVTAAGTGANAEKIILTTALTGGATLADGVEFFQLAAGANSVTTGGSGQTVNADALLAGQTLTLAGTHAATVSLTAGNLASSSSGNLTVTATAGANTITTGAGRDTISGGGGADVLTGGAEYDTFVIGATESLNTSLVTITDFQTNLQPAWDVLKLATRPTSIIATTGTANFSVAAAFASTGTTAGTLATDIATAVAAQIAVHANFWGQVGDTIAVTLNGASLAGTGAIYVIQNRAEDTTYDPTADTVVGLVGTSTAPYLASFG